MKKIVAVIGSPNEEKSNTCALVSDFLQQVQALDATVQYEIISLGRRRIEPCRGCWGCTRKGECVHQDDLQDIQARLLESDLFILGSPVYVDHVSAQMKIFIDRSFLWLHTLRLIGKPALTALTTAGSGAGPAERYLSEILYLFGAIPLGHLRGIAYQPGNFPQREACAKKHRLLAQRVAAVLNGQHVLRPRLQNYWYFWGMQTKARYGAGLLSYEHEYWQRKGWERLTFAQAMNRERSGGAG